MSWRALSGPPAETRACNLGKQALPNEKALKDGNSRSHPIHLALHFSHPLT